MIDEEMLKKALGPNGYQEWMNRFVFIKPETNKEKEFFDNQTEKYCQEINKKCAKTILRY